MHARLPFHTAADPPTSSEDTSVPDRAFRQAMLQSERIRIGLAVGMLTVLSALVIVRGAMGSPDVVQVWPWLLLLVVALLGHEALLFYRVNRALAGGRELPGWVVKASAVAETLAPTVAVLIFTGNPAVGPFRALVAPPSLAYFFFIIPSILRLNPSTSLLTGVASAVGYMGVVGWTFWHDPAHDARGYLQPSLYAIHGAALLIGGGLAAAVCRQLRQYVLAALKEAETRRQVEVFRRDLDIARSIQEGLLPRTPPPIVGYEVAGWSKPADQTGGDYFDWQQLPDGRAALSLADVAGHGIGPALVTAVCRAYARASLPPAGLSCGGDLPALMQRVNALLTDDMQSGRFVTFVAAFVCPESNEVHLCSAGHGPLLVYEAATNDVREVEAQGIPFGIMADSEYHPPAAIRMAPGDVLILLTDGFFEQADRSGDRYGLDRLRASIRTHAGKAPGDMIQALYAEVLTFAGGAPQGDDLTAVVLKRAGSS